MGKAENKLSELYFGPVLIVSGYYAGRVGLYDDDGSGGDGCDCDDFYEEDCDSCAASEKDVLGIIYLWGHENCVYIDPNRLRNITVHDCDDFFKNTMWLSIEAHHRKVVAAEAAAAAAADLTKIPGIRAVDMPRPVVYFLLRGNQLQYIGQTVSLGSRLASHRRDKDFDTVRCIDVPKDQLLMVESALIRHFKPPLNKSQGAPRGEDIPLLRSIGIDPTATQNQGDWPGGLTT